MGSLIVAAGVLLVLLVLWDTFETIVLSKTVRRRYTLTVLVYGALWRVWKFLGRRTMPSIRQWVLVSFGPMSLLFLIAIWALLLVCGFGLMEFGSSAFGDRSFGEYVYGSGVTFFTLGYGDVVPVTASGRILAILEAGMGFGFLGVVIGYIPVMYASVSRREAQIVLLDSKAGSNPSAGELLKRHGEGEAMESLIGLLKEWELWSAQQLEAYLSYPVLAYYRSQHDDQSWLLSLTSILDACSLIAIGFEGEESKAWAKPLRFQANATFAMARHVIVDLAYIQDIPPTEHPYDRLTSRDWRVLNDSLRAAGIPLRAGGEDVLSERRALYEPYVVGLARDMFYTLPAWVHAPDQLDNWQVSAWESDGHF